MCGIAGIIDAQSRDLEDDLREMNNALSHRGPDDEGLRLWRKQGVGLAHRRLSIIDLSSAGQQPMTNEDGSVWIVFNGEIYNYKSLRRTLEKQGHIFRSDTDTEVIVHAYEEWGDEHVHRLRGMFAYALYDERVSATGSGKERPGRLLLVRDRLGIKPLVYYRDEHRFAFASEIQSILACDFADRDIDRSALFDLMTYRYVPAPKTAYEHIRKLPPGHLLIVEDGEITKRPYWDVPLREDTSINSIEEASETVRETLEEAVRLHMISDVPTGTFLSGGVDSSIVTALMAQNSPEPVSSFSIGFDQEGHSETEYARLIAQRYQTDHHERTVRSESMQQMLPRMIQMFGEPHADGSAMPTFRVSSVARENVKVVLSGDGGDEVFGGYRWYSSWMRLRKYDAMPAALRRPFFASVGHFWPARWRGAGLFADLASDPLTQYARRMEVFSPREKREVLGRDWREQFREYDDYWYFRQFWKEDLDPFTRVQYLDLKTFLPDAVLSKVDRASMAVGLEVRPPLLDHVLVEKVFSIPARLRTPGGKKKYLLKHATRDLLPEAIRNRSKKGFGSPLTAWMQQERPFVRRHLQNGNGRLDFLREDLGDWSASIEHGGKLWTLLLMQYWQRQNTV